MSDIEFSLEEYQKNWLFEAVEYGDLDLSMEFVYLSFKGKMNWMIWSVEQYDQYKFHNLSC